MDINNEKYKKHVIEDYEEHISIQLAGRIVILAEKPGEENPYMIVNCRWDNLFGAYEYYDAAVTPDYLEAVGELIRREADLLQSLEAERSLSGLPFHTLTAADCIPKSMDEALTGKIVVVKPEVLAHEYRSAEHQLTRVDTGSGASPNARGSAVFCTNLYDGKQVRHERHQIAGVIDPGKMPEWAKAKLADLQAGKDNPSDEIKAQAKKPSLQDKLNAAKEAARDAANNNTRDSKQKKRGGMEVD